MTSELLKPLSIKQNLRIRTDIKRESMKNLQSKTGKNTIRRRNRKQNDTTPNVGGRNNKQYNIL